MRGAILQRFSFALKMSYYISRHSFPVDVFDQRLPYFAKPHGWLQFDLILVREISLSVVPEIVLFLDAKKSIINYIIVRKILCAAFLRFDLIYHQSVDEVSPQLSTPASH